MIRLVYIVILFLAFEIIGSALAESAADDEANVDNGTMDLITTISGYTFTADQSVQGTGFANVNNNLNVIDTSTDSLPTLTIQYLGSGSGAYNYESKNYIQNNVVTTLGGDFSSSSYKITKKDDTSAAYSPVAFQFPGSFKLKSLKSPWKDQTYTKNYAGEISMDYLIINANTINSHTNTELASDVYTYPGYSSATNSTISSSMDIDSQFSGDAHIGATIDNDTIMNFNGESLRMMDKKPGNYSLLVDEDYRGVFNITKKMAVTIKKTTDYGYYDANAYEYEGDYPWLPCLCNLGWEDMTLHDKLPHSAKDFFNCATCVAPSPCKN